MEQRAGGVGILGWPVLGAAVVLVVGVALPWVTVTAHIPSGLFGTTPDPSYTVSGFGQVVWGVAVLVCGLAGGVLGVTGAITGNGWLTGASGLPGLAALAALVISFIQTTLAKPAFPPGRLPRGLPPELVSLFRANAEATPAFGWYVTTAAALALTAMAIAATAITLIRHPQPSPAARPA